MVPKKRSSKRQTLQNKYKIVKRAKDHKKKLKQGKLKKTFSGKKKRIEDSIPNAWPYKDELLKDIAAAKEKMQEMKERKKELRAKEQAELASSGRKMRVEKEYHDDESSDDEMNVDESDNEENDSNDGTLDVKNRDGGMNSRRAYMRELRKVVESADVILHVLDARDPIGTKSSLIEDMVLSNYRKKLVYVLNKSDLVPCDVLAEWLRFLRQNHPAIPFKSNTQNQKGNLGRGSGKVSSNSSSSASITSGNSTITNTNTSKAVGVDELLGLLKNYARVDGDAQTKAAIAVGIVGFPNVGKSSLINSLTRNRALGVSSTPGFTKNMAEVILDKNIRLLDSPGIVFESGESTAVALRNCINVESMDDVISPVQGILDRCPQHYLMQLYSIPRFKEKDALSFLALLAKYQGKLKKGGIPNTEAAARTVLHDWNTGKIKFYCKAPSLKTTGKTNKSIEKEGKIVNEFTDELDIDQMASGVLDTLEAMEEDANDDFIGMDAVADEIDDTEDMEANDDDRAKPVKKSTVMKAQQQRRKKAIKSNGKKEAYDFNEFF